MMFLLVSMAFLAVVNAVPCEVNDPAEHCKEGTCPNSCINQGNDCKIYLMAFTSIGKGSFFNGDELVGSHVDLLKEICCIAKKRCDAALYDFNRCWRSDGTSDVLNGRWSDGCIEVSNTPRRRATFAFGRVPLFTLGNAKVCFSMMSGITQDSLRKPSDNNFDLVYMSNPNLATSDAKAAFDEDYQVGGTETGINREDGNQEAQEIFEAIEANPSNTVGILATHFISPEQQDTLTCFELDTPLGNSTIMIRKDNADLLCWFDDAYCKFLCSSKYKPFCDKAAEKFGESDVHCLTDEQREDVCCNTCPEITKINAN